MTTLGPSDPARLSHTHDLQLDGVIPKLAVPGNRQARTTKTQLRQLPPVGGLRRLNLKPGESFNIFTTPSETQQQYGSTQAEKGCHRRQQGRWYVVVTRGLRKLHMQSSKQAKQHADARLCPGKSSMTVQFVDGHFVDSYYPTIENTFSKMIKYKNQEYATEIIDTAGQVPEVFFSPRVAKPSPAPHPTITMPV